MKFNVVVCDPPYNFLDGLNISDVKRGSQANYNTMTIQQIKDMRIKDIVDPDGALLALWVPSSLLQEGLDIMKEFGFIFKQTWIWIKLKKEPFKQFKKNKDFKLEEINLEQLLSFGMGRIGRNVHEICLIGVRGKIYKKIQNRSQRTVFFYKNEKHSKKPELLQDKLDMIFPDTNKIEIFARRQRPGWHCIGNEIVQGEDINESISKLL